MVYRGCADPRNLPLGVDSSVQCREQGRLPAVWWFCNGTLCNSGQFSAVCSADSKNANSGLFRFMMFLQYVVCSGLSFIITSIGLCYRFVAGFRLDCLQCFEAVGWAAGRASGL